jgi:aminoglycoside phosphotransferase (APT) family kinase protein
MKPGMMTRKQFAERYLERSGRHADNLVFYYAFGLLKTAVVLQQIYYRWRQGTTSDPRFAQLIFGVRILSEQARAAIDRGTI